MASTGSQSSFAAEAVVASEPSIHDVYEKKTGSFQYVVADPVTRKAVIIDPVLDFDSATGSVSTQTADSLLALVKEKDYHIDMILETHAHADHMTAASYLRKRLAEDQGHAPLIGIGRRIKQAQEMFCERYRIPPKEYVAVFDKLLDDDETFNIGTLSAVSIYLPGHTPDHMGYKIGDNVFGGDSIFHIDLGSARADFPGGSAETLFASGRKLLSLPEHVKIWIGHDYPHEGREAPVPCVTVGDHRKHNKHLKDSIERQDFVELRKKRDATLAEPKLLHQSLQMNLRAGRLPEPAEGGRRMLYIPLKLQNVEW